MTTTVGLSPPMFLQFFNPNNSGSPAAGYKLFTYRAGTSTKQATYTDSSGSVQNANPIILDSNGRASVWNDVSLSYKYVVAPPNDTDPPTSPVWTQDNIQGAAGVFVPGVYNPAFISGPVMWKGASGLAADNNMIFGLNLPNPSGNNSAALLLGSGGGGGIPIQAWIISDQAFDASTPGNTLGITAGETQNAGTAAGGDLLLYGGASFGGMGGRILLEGGTSFNGNGGWAVLHGGNSTHGASGDVFVEGGETGTQGSSVHLIATNIAGIAGDVRIRSNSDVLIQFLKSGEIYLTKSGTAEGVLGQCLTSQGPAAAAAWKGGHTTSSPGYEIFPSGTIIQWGGATTPNLGIPADQSITFPLQFPNACFGVFVCTNRSVASDGQAASGSNFASNITTTGCTITIDSSSGGTTSHWMAIGR